VQRIRVDVRLGTGVPLVLCNGIDGTYIPYTPAVMST
jgi:hypothetical protein